MSADAITVCPACYSKGLGKPFSEVTLEDLNATRLFGNELREFHDTYIDKGMLHFDFEAKCNGCGYTVQLELSAPLPNPSAS